MQSLGLEGTTRAALGWAKPPHITASHIPTQARARLRAALPVAFGAPAEAVSRASSADGDTGAH